MLFTLLWIFWGLAFAVIEGIALFNSRKGDTLSEHIWAWIGVRDSGWRFNREKWTSRPNNSWTVHPPVTPKWTLRVARIIMISFMVWLILHFATGGWV